jgi:sensor histidine kinase regulating citrate/malate metabolism
LPEAIAAVIFRQFLNYKVELAAQFGIEFEVKASAPRNGELNAEDLSICLGNLLDNAIEAVAGLQKEKVIKVKLKVDKGNLFINVTNPYLTAKKEKARIMGNIPKCITPLLVMSRWRYCGTGS